MPVSIWSLIYDDPEEEYNKLGVGYKTPWANIESSHVWDTSCLAELICDLINGSFMREVSWTGDDSILARRSQGMDGPRFYFDQTDHKLHH